MSITQSTELGTLYTPAEMQAIADHAHAHGMLFHVDGSRLANAAASLDVPLRAITTDVGADVVSFGGTKIGLVAGEAVLVLRADLADPVRYLRKQTVQLASKMRFISAQLLALLENDLWRRAAGHANAMARRLGEAIEGAEGVTLTQAVQANGVFAILPEGAAERLLEDFKFYFWDEHTREVRWMCAWDTTEEDVDAFAFAIAEVPRRLDDRREKPGDLNSSSVSRRARLRSPGFLADGHGCRNGSLHERSRPNGGAAVRRRRARA